MSFTDLKLASNLSPLYRPRASAAAERLWSEVSMNVDIISVSQRLEEHRCRMLKLVMDEGEGGREGGREREGKWERGRGKEWNVGRRGRSKGRKIRGNE